MMLGVIANQTEPHTWSGTPRLIGASQINFRLRSPAESFISALLAGAGGVIVDSHVKGIQPTSVLWTGSGGLLALSSMKQSAFSTMIGTGVINPWTPDNLSTLVMWFDANDASSITIESGKVSAWNDKSVNANHATQNTVNLRPSTSNFINGKGTISFTSTPLQNLSLNGVPNLTTGIGFAVAIKMNSTNNQGIFEISDNSTVNRTMNFYMGSSSAIIASQGASPGAPFSDITNAHIWSGYTNTTDRELFLDGSSFVSQTFTVSNLLSHQLQLGSLFDFTYPMTGHMGEIIFFSGISISDRQTLEGYLAWKWGKQGSLPGDHPYKFGPPTQLNAINVGNPIKQGSISFDGAGELNVNAFMSAFDISSLFLGAGGLSLDATLDSMIKQGLATFEGAGNISSFMRMLQSGSSVFAGAGQMVKHFSPSDLSSLVGWWDANDSSTLTDAGSGHCSQWNDKSTNANNVTQSTDGNRPVITASSINGNTALVFTRASNQYLANLAATGLPNINTGLSFAAVGQFNTSDDQAIFDVSNSTNTNTAAQLILTNTNDLNYRNGGNPGAYETSYTDLSNANVFSGSMCSSPNQSFLWVNGTASSNSGSGTNTNFACDHLRFGRLFQDVFSLGGKIAEIVFTSGEISTTDRQKLEGYLAWKWGRQSALPGDHPYASSPP